MLALALLALVITAPGADAKRNIEVGFADDRFADNLFMGPDASVRARWFDRLDDTNAGLLRINLYWNQVAKTEPAAARNPADPAYDWSEIDRAVRGAEGTDAKVFFTVLLAPAWAEGPNRPSLEEARAGTWRPDPAAFEDFAFAVATRYSGAFVDPANAIEGPLPRVVYYEGWNEPNLHNYIEPQRQGKKNTSPAIYRELLNAFYDGVKAVHGSNQVIAAGTSPFGDPTGSRRIPPLEFWRDVFCLKDNRKLSFKKKGCPKGEQRAHLDIFAHNSINEPGSGPRQSAKLDDNATAADMRGLVKIIRAAEKHKTAKPNGKKRETWSTELWYESKPPEKKGAPLAKHARWLSEAIYLLWKQKVDAGVFLQLRDSDYDPSTPAVIGLQSGVYFFDERPKPALDSVRFPFYAERSSGKKIKVWGKAPSAGKVQIQYKRGKGYKKFASLRARSAGEVFSKKLKLKGSRKVRAVSGGQQSVDWKVKR